MITQHELGDISECKDAPLHPRLSPSRPALAALIVVSTVFIGWLDLQTSVDLIVAILFSFPLALCALHPSKRLLWCTAAAATVLTIAAGLWGIDRLGLAGPWATAVNRAFLIASLLTLTIFIHFLRDRGQKILLDTAEIERQRSNLGNQTAQLQVMATAATRSLDVHKESEKNLAQMESRYRGLLEAAPDAMVVVNPAGDIVLLNLQAEKQFGYRRDELLGQPVRNIIPEGFAERLIADGTRSAAEALTQQIGTGIELSGRRKNGSDFPIEIMLSPLQSPEGILVTAAIRNISVRKEAEEHLGQMEGRRRTMEAELRESEERYRLLLDGVDGYAIFMMDPQGKILSWNAGAERIKGYRTDEIIGRNYACFFPGEDIQRGRPQQVLRTAAEHGRNEEQGLRVRKDGSRFLASVVITALRDPAGNLRGFSEFSHDLSESKESGAKYRGLLEAAPDAMVVVDQAGSIVLLNLQAENQFGYHRDELVGQQVTNIVPEGFAERLHRRWTALGGRRTGAADRYRNRALRAAQGRERVSHRDHAEPAEERSREFSLRPPSATSPSARRPRRTWSGRWTS